MWVLEQLILFVYFYFSITVGDELEENTKTAENSAQFKLSVEQKCLSEKISTTEQSESISVEETCALLAFENEVYWRKRYEKYFKKC